MGLGVVSHSRHLSGSPPGGFAPSTPLDIFITPTVVTVGRGPWRSSVGGGWRGAKPPQKIRVDGYEPTTGTVYQYHGCYWYGCPCIDREGPGRGSLESTLEIDAAIAEKHPMVIVWEHEVPNPPKIKFDHQFHPYPGFIVYDFEARMKKVGEQKTEFYEVYSEHVPVSVAISDNVTKEPVYLVDPDPKSLVTRFIKVLVDKREAILKKVREMYPLIANKKKWIKWEEQVPVFGFNSSNYDLRLIMRYFTEDICNLGGVKMAEKDGSFFFILTKQFKFLDVRKFLKPGSSYKKWIVSHGWKNAKLSFPYDWLDDFGKLSQGPPPIEGFTTKMKGPLKKYKYDIFLSKYQEEGCENMGDWLRVYNFVDCLQKEINKYLPFGIDMCKDAVSIPGVSLRYLINSSEKMLYAPTTKVYELLKKGMIGGPSIVFCRYAEAGKSRIKDHLFKDAKLCKSVVGYDANSLYPYTFSRQMPCGNGEYRTRSEIPKNVKEMILKDQFFGFFLVDIRVPDHLREQCSEFPPIFIATQVPDEQIAPAMRAYRDRTGRAKGARKLVSVLEAKKVLLYSPLIKWYLQKGLIIDQFYEAAIYKPGRPFSWFPEVVAQKRREADEKPKLFQVGETYKLLANSAYGKMIENLERQDRVELTVDVRRVQKLVLHPFFRDAEEVGDAFKLKMGKRSIVIDRPYQYGIAVYQLAKLRMLEFVYDMMHVYFDPHDYEFIQTDTDSLYMALSGDSFDEIVKPEMRVQWEESKWDWFPKTAWEKRTPGLFKEEFRGHKMNALCSKCYIAMGSETKTSAKGVKKKQNKLVWEQYFKALNLEEDEEVTTVGIGKGADGMITYAQKKKGYPAITIRDSFCQT